MLDLEVVVDGGVGGVDGLIPNVFGGLDLIGSCVEVAGCVEVEVCDVVT